MNSWLPRMDDEVKFAPKLASSRELEGMYAQLKETLTVIGFLNPENPDYWMMHIRRPVGPDDPPSPGGQDHPGGSAGRSNGTGTTRERKSEGPG